MTPNAAPRRSPATILAAALGISTATLLAGTAVMDVVVPWPKGTNTSDFLIFDLIFGSVALSFGVVGAVVAARVPRNPLPWLMAFIGLSAAISVSGGTYSTYYVNVAHGAAPAGDFISWFSNWQFQPALIASIVFVPLLFPDGRLASRRWRAFAAVGVAAIVAISLEAMFGAWSPGQSGGLTVNPYEVHGLLADALTAASTIANVTGPPALLIVMASLVLRFRRSRGVEREQFKWFAYAAAVTVGMVVVSNLTSGPISDTLFAVSMVTANLIPVAIGVAILRYRLYDIDVVINRTLVYGLLVVVLAAIYAASVLVLETVLAPVTQTNSLAVAVSTLVVAALFDPVRRRVRTVVDRRFYRRRYDAAREIAGFGSRLRDEVEPHRLAVAIATTLDRTVQPASASIWLRETADR